MSKDIGYYAYNNYYNRQLKKFNQLSDYSSFLISTEINKNIDINDGVNTIITAGTSIQTDNINYCIVYDHDTSNILSRWFIIESKKTRQGQYKLQLHRDVLADYYDNIITAPAFIEKAMLEIGDNAIFNKENMTFNQIKSSEYLLKENLGYGWIVGYMDVPASDTTINVTPRTENVKAIYADYTDYPFYNNATIINKNGAYIHTGAYTPVFYGPQAFITRAQSLIDDNRYYEFVTVNETTYEAQLSASTLVVKNEKGLNGTAQELTHTYRTIEPDIIESLNNETIQLEVGNIYEMNGKFFKVETLEYSQTTQTTSAYNTPAYSIFNQYISPIFNGPANYDSFALEGDVNLGRLVLQEIEEDTFSTTIRTVINTLIDAPYAMFALPYGGSITISGSEYYLTKKDALLISTQIVRQLTGSMVYDVQILPYCPRRDMIIGNNFVVSGTEGKDYSLIKNSQNNTVSALIWCLNSSFSFGLNRNFISYSDDPIEFKINCETRFIRICSPNYNGTYELTPEKSGKILRYNVFCSYRPYNPYIQIQPYFGRLYGGNFKDARGLICSGDFSLPQASDAWNSFQLNNKNYQQSFDREIQSIEFINKKSKTLDVVNAITGTVGAGVSGGMTGALAGPWGAVAGAAVGTVGGAVTGAMDVSMNESLRNEALDLKRDLFGFQLQNIQALPQSLTKVSSLSPVNKIFPFVEIFEASEIEKEALRNKIRYNGMTVGRVGTIQEFKKEEPTYIKGQFIRIEIDEDYHLANTIAEEFSKGVYI